MGLREIRVILNGRAMSKQREVEAEIKTSSGTVITVKGAADEVSKVAALFANGSQQGGGINSQAGTALYKGSLDGIAEKDNDGNVHVIVADLKAKNALDAAKRLLYVTLLARKRLLQEHKTNRRSVTSVLTNYGLNDGNTRNLISKDKALIKDGRKTLSLSAAAVPQAAKYIQEMQDPSLHGKWSPGTTRKRRKSKKTAAKSKQ
jgi:hypothetical protein